MDERCVGTLYSTAVRLPQGRFVQTVTFPLIRPTSRPASPQGEAFECVYLVFSEWRRPCSADGNLFVCSADNSPNRGITLTQGKPWSQKNHCLSFGTVVLFSSVRFLTGIRISKANLLFSRFMVQVPPYLFAGNMISQSRCVLKPESFNSWQYDIIDLICPLVFNQIMSPSSDHDTR